MKDEREGGGRRGEENMSAGRSVEHYKGFFEEALSGIQGWHPAMVRVVGVIMVVGEKVAVGVGTRIPGKLPVASLNLHCPHEGTMENQKRKGPEKRVK